MAILKMLTQQPELKRGMNFLKNSRIREVYHMFFLTQIFLNFINRTGNMMRGLFVVQLQYLFFKRFVNYTMCQVHFIICSSLILTNFIR